MVAIIQAGRTPAMRPASEDPPIDTTHYPALALRFDKDGVDAVNGNANAVVRCPVSGAEIGSNTADFFTVESDGAVRPNSVLGTYLYSGSYLPVGAKDIFLLLAVAKDTRSSTDVAYGFGIGDYAGNGPGIGHTIKGGDAWVTKSAAVWRDEAALLPPVSVPAPAMCTYVEDLNALTTGQLDGYTGVSDASGLTNVTALTGGAAAISGQWGDFTTHFTWPQFKAFYGIYAFYLDTQLSKDFIWSMLAWMAQNPGRMYPGLEGVA